jgi:hypothetical protein
MAEASVFFGGPLVFLGRGVVPIGRRLPGEAPRPRRPVQGYGVADMDLTLSSRCHPLRGLVLGLAGVCSVPLLEGEALEGLWFDRTQEYLARRRGKKFDPLEYATREVLELDPLPCWKHLTEEQRRARIAALVEDIETEAAARRKRTGAKPLGVAAVLAQNPLRRPKKTKKSPAPAFHAASKIVRRELWNAYSWFVAAYRDAAEKLRAGVRDVVFPRGSFPPALPFVSG